MSVSENLSHIQNSKHLDGFERFQPLSWSSSKCERKTLLLARINLANEEQNQIIYKIICYKVIIHYDNDNITKY